MWKVSSSRPDGVQEKKEKENSARSLGNMEEKKEGKWDREAENWRKEARDVAREGAQSNPLLFMR